MATTAKKTTATTKKESNCFIDILKRTNSKIRSDRALRIAKSVAMSYDAAINSKKKLIFELEDKLEEQLDLSADNRSTSINALKDFDGDAFIRDRSRLMFDLEIAKQELEIMEADAAFYKV